MAQSFSISKVAAGALITATQAGYAAGMLFLVPLGDRAETRQLVFALLIVTTAGMTIAGFAASFPILVIGALISGGTSVVVQILVPYAADLAPDHLRGRIVGRVVGGLLTGVLLSRTLGSWLAEATSWRVVFLTAAGFMAVLAVTLRFALPRREPTTTVPYGQLLLSTVRLAKTHPALRRRALYQAAMFGAFSAFWTTVSYVLTAPPFQYSQLGVGLFALVGAGGALIAPWAGRWADRGLSRPLTGAAFAVAAIAFGVAGFGRHSIILLAIAAIAVDMAVQSTLVFGQHTIYQLDSTARARLNSVYLATFFVGGAVGSQLGSFAYESAGWTGLTIFGAALPILALVWWTHFLQSARAAERA
jgi:predicted MFS family arabinose efflux permease